MMTEPLIATPIPRHRGERSAQSLLPSLVEPHPDRLDAPRLAPGSAEFAVPEGPNIALVGDVRCIGDVELFLGPTRALDGKALQAEAPAPQRR